MDTPEETKQLSDVELIAQIINEQKDQILATVRDNLKKQVITSLTYSAQESIRNAVGKFIDEQMKDDLAAIVAEMKGVLLAEVKKQMPVIAAEFGALLVRQATKNFQVDSYKSADMIKKIFE